MTGKALATMIKTQPQSQTGTVGLALRDAVAKMEGKR